MTFILAIHHYIALVLLFITAFTASYVFYAAFKRHQALQRIKKFSFITVSLLHFQLIFGLLLSFKYFSSLSDVDLGFKEIMTNTQVRYQAIEHPMMMLTSIIFATIANVYLKKNAHNKKAAFFLLIAFVCMLSRFPFEKVFS